MNCANEALSNYWCRPLYIYIYTLLAFCVQSSEGPTLGVGSPLTKLTGIMLDTVRSVLLRVRAQFDSVFFPDRDISFCYDGDDDDISL